MLGTSALKSHQDGGILDREYKSIVFGCSDFAFLEGNLLLHWPGSSHTSALRSKSRFPHSPPTGQAAEFRVGFQRRDRPLVCGNAPESCRAIEQRWNRSRGAATGACRGASCRGSL